MSNLSVLGKINTQTVATDEQASKKTVSTNLRPGIVGLRSIRTAYYDKLLGKSGGKRKTRKSTSLTRKIQQKKRKTYRKK